MKVYVCECEQHNGHPNESVAVFSSLDAALEKMRVEFVGYKETHPDACVEWLEGGFERRTWGWYNVDRADEFTVREFELDAFDGRRCVE